jgi:hypothetical protein
VLVTFLVVMFVVFGGFGILLYRTRRASVREAERQRRLRAERAEIEHRRWSPNAEPYGPRLGVGDRAEHDRLHRRMEGLRQGSAEDRALRASKAAHPSRRPLRDDDITSTTTGAWLASTDSGSSSHHSHSHDSSAYDGGSSSTYDSGSSGYDGGGSYDSGSSGSFDG